MTGCYMILDVCVSPSRKKESLLVFNWSWRHDDLKLMLTFREQVGRSRRRQSKMLSILLLKTLPRSIRKVIKNLQFRFSVQLKSMRLFLFILWFNLYFSFFINKVVKCILNTRTGKFKHLGNYRGLTFHLFKIFNWIDPK